MVNAALGSWAVSSEHVAMPVGSGASSLRNRHLGTGALWCGACSPGPRDAWRARDGWAAKEEKKPVTPILVFSVCFHLLVLWNKHQQILEVYVFKITCVHLIVFQMDSNKYCGHTNIPPG